MSIIFRFLFVHTTRADVGHVQVLGVMTQSSNEYIKTCVVGKLASKTMFA